MERYRWFLFFVSKFNAYTIIIKQEKGAGLGGYNMDGTERGIMQIQTIIL